MTQLRRHSFLEACMNTASGFGISYLAWPLVCRYVLRVPFRPGRGLEVILVFTVLSICRNYLWRRLFNRRRLRDLQAGGTRAGFLTPNEARSMFGPAPAQPERLSGARRGAGYQPVSSSSRKPLPPPRRP